MKHNKLTTNLAKGLALGAILMIAGVVNADIGANQQVQLEAQLQQRLMTIVGKGDPQAIVQVRVDVKKISTALPGVWTDASAVTPVVADGTLSIDGIDAIHVRVLTQTADLPAWIKAEVKNALSFDKIRVDMKFEKAKGAIADAAKTDSVSDVIKNFGKELTIGLSQNDSGKIGHDITFAIWGVVGGLALTMLFLFAAIFMLGKKIEGAFLRVVEEKLAPLMQAQPGAPAARRDSTGETAGGNARGRLAAAGAAQGRGELNDVSNEALLAIVMDCYWTRSDAYANFIWTEASRAQREFLLENVEMGAELYRYFSYVRQFEVENLEYHKDVRYSEASPMFFRIDQADLAKHVVATPEHAALVTPLRWDLLPMSLAERMKLTVLMNSAPSTHLSATVALKASALRELPRRLEVKTLSAEDESFLWENSDQVPKDLRAGLNSLVWLALSPLVYRERVLGDIDARDLADAWTGPAIVLEKLKEAVPPKKYDMVEHFLKDATPDRNGSTFGRLVAMGVEGLNQVVDETPVEKATAA